MHTADSGSWGSEISSECGSRTPAFAIVAYPRTLKVAAPLPHSKVLHLAALIGSSDFQLPQVILHRLHLQPKMPAILCRSRAAVRPNDPE